MNFSVPIPSCSNENFYFHVGDYSFGFNGKELDKEGMGGGASTYDYGFRIYNSALGRFLSADPLTKSYPWNSTYAYAENRIIDGIDLDGLEHLSIHVHTVNGVVVQLNITKVNGTTGLTVTVKEVRHSTDINGKINSSFEVPLTVNQITPIVQEVFNDINGTGAATTQGRMSCYPTPIPMLLAQAQDQAALNRILKPNQGDQMLRIGVYGQFNNVFSDSNPDGSPPTFATALTTAINTGSTNPTGLTTTLPNNVTSVMIITNGTPASIANAQAQVQILTDNEAYSGITFSIVNDPRMIAQMNLEIPTSNPNSIGIILNPTANRIVFGQQIGLINPSQYIMLPTSLGTVDNGTMLQTAPTMNSSGLQNSNGQPTE